MGRIKNRLIARLFTAWPALAERAAAKTQSVGVSEDLSEEIFHEVPWAPFTKGLRRATIALVTTSGVHLRNQEPFDMKDPDGDPTWRAIPAATAPEDLMITHDYYDHSDADRDINVVFPIERLKELAEAGVIGGVASCHYSFMGHITGEHVNTLIKSTGPEVAQSLAGVGVDAVVLTPG